MQQERYFNTSGPNILEEHYTILRPHLIKEGIELIKRSRYFTIWAPRQTGKSTYFRFLSTELEKEGYKVCCTNFEDYFNADINTFLQKLKIDINNFWQIDFNDNNIQSLFTTITEIKDKKYVLIIDEVEAINPEYFGVFLHSIRNTYQTRNTHALKSVIFVGISNITGVVSENASPFNISESFDLPYFSKQELYELYAQHEQETSQLFEEKVKDKIYEITGGQPGLVNGFAAELVKRNKEKPIITYQDYLIVEHWYLYETLDKNVSNVINKAKKHQAFMEKLLFIEKPVKFNIYDERICFFFINGLITKGEDGNIIFGVPLYKKCLLAYFYPSLNGESEVIKENIDIRAYFTEEKMLNFDKIIRDYQVYVKKRGFQYFIQRDEEGNPLGILEAGLMYSFETYIQSFLQVIKGKSYIEAHVALGRSDLIVNIQGNEAVIEGKVYNNITQFTDGKEQLAYYIQSLGLTKGIYLVFVSSTVTHPLVTEAIETFNVSTASNTNIEIATYLVRYDLKKDFSEPRKRNYQKKEKKG